MNLRSDASISVVIPTYNCAHLLPHAIRSAYRQTVPPAEVVVVNDGSTDETAEVLRALATELPNTFVWETKKNGGEASGRNRGVELAKGDYIAFLDQDDVWLPDKIEQQMNLFRQHPDLGLTFTAYTRISADNREVVCLRGWDPAPEAVLRQLMLGCCITPSTVIVRRSVLDAVGPFDTSLWLGCDWTMWLRIAAAGHRIGYLPEALTEYLWHENNMSRDLRRVSQAAQVIFPRFFQSGSLPASIQRLEQWCYARWHLIDACHALEAGEMRDARRQLGLAARKHPGSVRLGWGLMYLRTLFGTRSATLK